MNIRRPKQGFTLLELVTAMTLLLALILLTTRLFHQSTSIIEREERALLLDSAARQLLDQLEETISQSLIRSNVLFSVTQNRHGTNDTLYLISPAIRVANAGYKRDMAPLLIEPIPGAFESRLLLRHPTGTGKGAKNELKNSIFYSAYYNNTQPLSLNSSQSWSAHLSEKQTDDTEAIEIVALQFTHPHNIHPPPYIDLYLQLMDTRSLKRRAQWNLSDERYQKRISQNSKIYTRRIWMRNVGTETLFKP
jgi:prepilin-type N-terminal cleavage/methylation domain-containing protein